MSYRRTTVLPKGDTTQAQQVFQKALAQPDVLLVVLEDTAEAEAWVAMAVDYVGSDDDLRWVVWAPEPNAIQSQLSQLDGSPELRQKLAAGARAFSLSADRKLRDVITQTEQLDSPRVLAAYTRAEA